MLKPVLKFVALSTLLASSFSASAAVISTDRTAFVNGLSTYVVDDYENPGYRHGDRIDLPYLDAFSDQAMNGVVKQTHYKATGFNNLNLLVGTDNHSYCAGCNGSFLLDFTQTTLGASTGINAVGFDFARSSNYFATVSLANGAFFNYYVGLGDGFWGINSDIAINSIHFGLANGGITTSGYLQIDNLTIGTVNVPEPGPWALLGLGLFGLLLSRRRHND